MIWILLGLEAWVILSIAWFLYTIGRKNAKLSFFEKIFDGILLAPVLVICHILGWLLNKR